MALSATAAASLLDGYTNGRISLLMSTAAGFTADGTDVLGVLNSTRTTIINDIVASAQLPAKNATQAGAMLDSYAAACISAQTPAVGLTADGTDVNGALAATRTNVLNYLTH